jgi:hypothetical protein
MSLVDDYVTAANNVPPATRQLTPTFSTSIPAIIIFLAIALIAFPFLRKKL